MLPKVLDGIPWPGRPSVTDFELGNAKAGIVSSPAAQGAPAEESGEGAQRVIGIGWRIGTRIAQGEDVFGFNAVDEKGAPLALDEVEVSAPLLLGTWAELAPFGAGFVGAVSGKRAGASSGCRFACGEAIGGPPFRIGGAIRIEGSTGQLDALSRTLGAAEGVIREILFAARRRAMDVRWEL